MVVVLVRDNGGCLSRVMVWGRMVVVERRAVDRVICEGRYGE